MNNSTHICELCFKQIPFRKCGIEKLCLDYPYSHLDIKLISACNYEGNIKHALIRYKFMNKPGYSRAFTALLIDKMKKVTNCRNFDMILSVPLYNSREKLRGYNQSRLISEGMGRGLNITEGSSLIKRVRETKSQSSLNKEDRISNINGAFKVIDTSKIKDKAIILIDDIATTGSTMGECCKCLLEAGAKEVFCAVVASGRK